MFALHAATAAAIGVTHSRVPAERLYNSRRGGLSRAAVFGCFPTAVAAVATLPSGRVAGCAGRAAAVRDRGRSPASSTSATWTAGRRNLPATRRRRRWPPRRRRRAAAAADARRSAASPRTGLATAPGRDLGAHGCWPTPGIQTAGMAQPSPGEPGVDRVHLGHHEGLDGALLAWDALLLSRRRTGRLHGWYLALMLTYGVAVAAQDAWLEQVVKRGWTRPADARRRRARLRTRAWAGAARGDAARPAAAHS